VRHQRFPAILTPESDFGVMSTRIFLQDCACFVCGNRSLMRVRIPNATTPTPHIDSTSTSRIGTTAHSTNRNHRSIRESRTSTKSRVMATAARIPGTRRRTLDSGDHRLVSPWHASWTPHLPQLITQPSSWNGVLATRNPMLLFVFVGVLLLRFEARQLLELLFQLPPRTTRLGH